MYFFDELASSVRDQGLALGKMIVTTEPTERQLKTKRVLDQVYGVTKNLFFLGIIGTCVTYLLLRFAGAHPALLPTLKVLWDKLSFPALAGVLLALVALLLLLLRGLLFVFKYVNATELTKFYLFIELINMVHQYLDKPDVRPTPFLVEMLKKILDL